MANPATPKAEDDGRAELRREFRAVVNMAPAALERWLQTEESRSVGWGDEGAETIGHHSGRRILAIKRKTVADLTAADYAHMSKVVGYVHRHLAQGPAKEKADSRWRYALMNWGHDPLKD